MDPSNQQPTGAQAVDSEPGTTSTESTTPPDPFHSQRSDGAPTDPDDLIASQDSDLILARPTDGTAGRDDGPSAPGLPVQPTGGVAFQHVENGGVTASPTAGGPIDQFDPSGYDPAFDASKTVPSQFGNRRKSAAVMRNTRDSHHDGHKERDANFHETLDDMGSGLFNLNRRRKSAKGGSSDEVEKQVDAAIKEDSPIKGLASKNEGADNDDVGDSPKPGIVKRMSTAIAEVAGSPKRLVGHLRKSSKSDDIEKTDDTADSPKPSLLGHFRKGSKNEDIEKKDV